MRKSRKRESRIVNRDDGMHLGFKKKRKGMYSSSSAKAGNRSYLAGNTNDQPVKTGIKPKEKRTSGTIPGLTEKMEIRREPLFSRNL